MVLIRLTEQHEVNPMHAAQLVAQGKAEYVVDTTVAEPAKPKKKAAKDKEDEGEDQ